jgi:hypothetical protein
MIKYEDSSRRRSQGVQFEFKSDVTVISFDDGSSECVHELKPEKYQAFLEWIGQSEAASIEAGVQAAVENRDFEKLNLGAHEYAEVVFSWNS